jgi:hypothetical protein
MWRQEFAARLLLICITIASKMVADKRLNCVRVEQKHECRNKWAKLFVDNFPSEFNLSNFNKISRLIGSNIS